MPKSSSSLARKVVSEVEDYPQGTWAMLTPVDNADTTELPCIFLTEPFNCLGKFPDSIPAHHVTYLFIFNL